MNGESQNYTSLDGNTEWMDFSWLGWFDEVVSRQFKRYDLIATCADISQYDVPNNGFLSRKVI